MQLRNFESLFNQWSIWCKRSYNAVVDLLCSSQTWRQACLLKIKLFFGFVSVSVFVKRKKCQKNMRGKFCPLTFEICSGRSIARGFTWERRCLRQVRVRGEFYFRFKHFSFLIFVKVKVRGISDIFILSIIIRKIFM